MAVRNIRKKWGKTDLPIRLSILFIFFHWAVLFPVALAIDGHPPLPLLFVEMPTVITMYLFSFLLPSKIGRSFIAEYLLYIIAIPSATISYGLLGYTIGRFIEWRGKK